MRPEYIYTCWTVNCMAVNILYFYFCMSSSPELYKTLYSTKVALAVCCFKKVNEQSIQLHWSYLLYDISRLKYMFIMYIYVTGVLDKVPNTIFYKNKTKQKWDFWKTITPVSLVPQFIASFWRKAELLSAGRGTVWHDSPGNQRHSLEEDVKPFRRNEYWVFLLFVCFLHGPTSTCTISQPFELNCKDFHFEEMVQVLFRNPDQLL